MNIHGALAGPPPFHSKPPPSLSLLRSVSRPLVPPCPSTRSQHPHALPVASCPFTTPCDIHRTATSQRLKSQYAFVRLTKSTVGSTVKQIERERERERAAHRRRVSACGGRVSGWRRGLDQWSLPLNWKLRFERPSVDFHSPPPPSVLTARFCLEQEDLLHPLAPTNLLDEGETEDF